MFDEPSAAFASALLFLCLLLTLQPQEDELLVVQIVLARPVQKLQLSSYGWAVASH